MVYLYSLYSLLLYTIHVYVPSSTISNHSILSRLMIVFRSTILVVTGQSVSCDMTLNATFCVREILTAITGTYIDCGYISNTSITWNTSLLNIHIPNLQVIHLEN